MHNKKENRKQLLINYLRFFFVLEAGLEPAQPQWPRDFKSLVSTDSTIRASSRERAENEARTRDPNLGKVVLYQLSYFRNLQTLHQFQTLLAKVDSYPFSWGKVVFFQLN